MHLTEETVTIRHFHLFAGSGGGALGFNRGHARHGKLVAKMECVGGVDVDPGACRDFTRLVGVPATCLDLFDAGQYRDFHGHAPPAGWREATAEDIRAAAHGQDPDIVFLSAPCKGFSGLLNGEAAASTKYQALNRLTVRGIRLMLDAFEGNPPSLIIFENVPRIAQRGRALLDDIRHELELAGYAVNESAHDCGEIGGLAQHRNRFLLVARHLQKVPPFLYEPPKGRVLAVGEVIGSMPMPEAAGSGAMHRLPRCTLETYIRLALIQPGKDARSLHGMDLSRLGIARHPSLGEHAKMRVEAWDRPAHTVTGVDTRVGSGALSVGDVRPMEGWGGKGKYGVTPWNAATGTVIAASSTGNGAFALADIRGTTPRNWGGGECGVVPFDAPAGAVACESRPTNGAFSLGDIRLGEGRFNNVYRVVRFDEASQAVTGGGTPSSGGLSVADVRPMATSREVYGVTAWHEAMGAVTSQAAPGAGHFSLGDVRVGTGAKQAGRDWANAGNLGVTPWDEAARAVAASGQHDNGYGSVADPRHGTRPGEHLVLDGVDLGDLRAKVTEVPIIVSLWNTWNRPFTTLELAALQGYPWEDLTDRPLDGRSDSGWREHIGNSVPPPAAAAMASVMAHTLLLARAGVRFQLSATPIWVRRHAVALSLPRSPLHGVA